MATFSHATMGTTDQKNEDANAIDRIERVSIEDPGVLKAEKGDDDDAASVAESATGRHLPAGYYWSPNFIGTWAVSTRLFCLFLNLNAFSKKQ